jgi:hypothetical protein
MTDQKRSYWELVEPVFKLVDLDSPATFQESTVDVKRPILALFAAHSCLSEVHNGGFLQFFWNSTGVMAPESIEGFRALGMSELASVVSRAAEPLGNPYPRNREDRWDALLFASGRSEEELGALFRNASQGPTHLYLAFSNATETLSFESLNGLAWELAETENGGFDEAANRYAESLLLLD